MIRNDITHFFVVEPQINTFEPILVGIGSDYLILMEIGFQSFIPLAWAKIEIFTYQQKKDIVIPYPNYEKDRKVINFVTRCSLCEIKASFRVTIANIFCLRDVSEKIHLYFIPGRWILNPSYLFVISYKLQHSNHADHKELYVQFILSKSSQKLHWCVIIRC